MTTNSDPYVLTIFARQRHAAFQAEADRHRLAKLAAGNHAAPERRRWAERMPVVAVAVALLAAGAVTAQESVSQPLAALSRAADSVVSSLLAADEQETSAVQKVREAAQVETAAGQPTMDADLAKATPKQML
jgi:uncharacterized lipoprotein YajG